MMQLTVQKSLTLSATPLTTHLIAHWRNTNPLFTYPIGYYPELSFSQPSYLFYLLCPQHYLQGFWAQKRKEGGHATALPVPVSLDPVHPEILARPINCCNWSFLGTTGYLIFQIMASSRQFSTQLLRGSSQPSMV